MPAPIRVHTRPTPHGQKVHILPEQQGLPHEAVPVNTGPGAQFTPEFLALTPNHEPLSESARPRAGGDGLAGITTFPWVRNPERPNLDLAHVPHVQRWHDAIAARPTLRRGVDLRTAHRRRAAMTDKERENMFGATPFAARCSVAQSHSFVPHGSADMKPPLHPSGLHPTRIGG